MDAPAPSFHRDFRTAATCAIVGGIEGAAAPQAGRLTIIRDERHRRAATRRAEALATLDLRRDLVRHKSRFFSSGWTHCESAKPKTFRLVPQPARQAASAKDCATMASMFIGAPIEFDVMLQ